MSLARSIAGDGARIGFGAVGAMLAAMAAVAWTARASALAAVARASARCVFLARPEAARYAERACWRLRFAIAGAGTSLTPNSSGSMMSCAGDGGGLGVGLTMDEDRRCTCA